MSFTKEEIASLYRKRSRFYDFTANLYYLLGFREQAYRKKSVDALKLSPGDVVVEIGCGTGLNFPLLQKVIGPKGKIIGVDLTDEMLKQAQRRVKENGWSNVELVKSDAALFQFPSEIDGVISTFALTLSPEFDKIIQNGCKALKTGKSWVVLDLKMPSNRLRNFVPLFILLTHPFGVTKDLEVRRPWESMGKYLKNIHLKEFYMGFVYIAAGERGKDGCTEKNKKEILNITGSGVQKG
jgi:ubiquinone/menaquinone biosynthesis C-methylase UbiE